MVILEVALGAFIALVADRGLGAVIKARAAEQERERKQEFLRDSGLPGFIEKLTADLDHDNRMQKALHEATVATVGDRPPKPSEFKKVEAKFHEITGDHFVKLEAVKGTNRPNVTIQDKPFKRPATKKAPVKTPVAKTAPTKKTVTKKGK